MSLHILFRLQYDLSRRQRLIPHLVIWFPLLPAVVGVLFFIPALILSISVWLMPVGVLSLWFVKGFFIGLVQVVITPMQYMDIILEENGLGFLVDGERWWIFLDGVEYIRKINDTWTLRHHNGTVIIIPTEVISNEQVELLHSAIQQAKAKANKEATTD